MKIAIIGTGIAGNVAAYHLSKQHDVTVFEANDYIGGHTHTHDVSYKGDEYSIDTGFIVFNYKTYPNFIKLLDELGVEVQPSSMSFSVKCEKTGLEYNGTTLNSLFAQRSNFFRPSFYRMIKDILRFNKEALEVLEAKDESMSLGELLYKNRYSKEFIDHYIIPMGAAIWSSDPLLMHQFPAHYFIQFFHNHGMLNVNDRPEWYVIKGGSREYVKKLTAAFKDNIRLSTPVNKITRKADHVVIESDKYGSEIYDYVFIASHSDQALNMLSDASALEKQVLGSIPYQKNEAVLHTDHSLLPKRKLAWASWNYHLLKKEQESIALTYNMNILQGIKSPDPFCVTLNYSHEINPDHVIKTIQYDHPMFTPAGVSAQQRQQDINGINRTFYCGAYWRFGFHEDGVVSALNALEDFEGMVSHEKLHLRRAS